MKGLPIFIPWIRLATRTMHFTSRVFHLLTCLVRVEFTKPMFCQRNHLFLPACARVCYQNQALCSRLPHSLMPLERVRFRKQPLCMSSGIFQQNFDFQITLCIEKRIRYRSKAYLTIILRAQSIHLGPEHFSPRQNVCTCHRGAHAKRSNCLSPASA